MNRLARAGSSEYLDTAMGRYPIRITSEGSRGMVSILMGSQCSKTLQPITASTAFNETAVAVFSQLSV